MTVYPLNHSELSTEIERLEWNHFNVLVPLLDNCVVPPEVDAYLQDLITERTLALKDGQPPVSVADIGTGTGVWLVDLASSLPPTARLDGYDFNTSKFRPVDSRPPNVQLLEANAIEPFPAMLHGQYDLVHVRLLVLALQPPDWKALAANLKTLLRPGGYLVWEDVDTQHFKGSPETTKTAATMAQLIRFNKFRGQQGVPYPIDLDKLMAAEGYDDARQKAFKVSDVWEHPTLAKPTQNSLFTIIVSYMQGIVEFGGFEDLKTKEDAARKAAEAKAEIDAGDVKCDSYFWRTIARKPLA
ncbi:hypothetical protein SEUCBS140593_000244 [Sporothrix eucalyptigena]|uniref:Methyltransferase domain-containing protein n=1 Tax=Sporothrix eucalyptigena TaxID=1812306 RepID=A0ABP0AN40_9PEZI